MVLEPVEMLEGLRRQKTSEMLVPVERLAGQDAREQEARHHHHRKHEDRHQSGGEIGPAAQQPVEQSIGGSEHDGEDRRPGDGVGVGQQ